MAADLNGVCSRCGRANPGAVVRRTAAGGVHRAVEPPWVLIGHAMFPGPEVRALEHIPSSGAGHRILCKPCIDTVWEAMDDDERRSLTREYEGYARMRGYLHAV